MRAQAAGYHPDLQAALDLLLSSGGKRIRPTLTLLIGRMLGAPSEKLITLAAAIELLHSATLVHDDLIDGALLRRGIPTLNSQWTPGATVLTGDFLFAQAAKLAAETENVPVIKLYAQTLTVIVNGELTQMLDSRCLVSRDDYYKRIYAKTASLFETSATSAAMIGTTDEKLIEKMRQFGYNIGTGFQIVDDILDFTGEQATVGKPVGSDLRQGLITLPTLCYLEANPDTPLAQPIRNGKCQENREQLDRLVEEIRHSPAIEAAMAEARQYIQKGLDILRELPDLPEVKALEELARYIVQREI